MPYLRGSDGTVYLYEEQPRAAWTAAEWDAELARLRAEIGYLEGELANYPRPPADWPQEAVLLWEQVHGAILHDLETRIAELTAKLAEMEAV